MKTKIITLLTALAISSVSMAQIINVPGDQPTIQAGIDAAVDGDTVLVDTGTYIENITFSGKAITVASKYITEGDTNLINNTIIDGSQPANPDAGSVVTFSSGEDSTSVICGFTITGGTGTYYGGVRCGGGLYCNYAGAKIINNKIVNNTSENSNYACGGGIGCRSGSSWIVIRDNTIRDNIVSSANANANGGGIYSTNNSQLISNNVISHDSLSAYNTFGGAVFIDNTSHTEMTENIITRNKVNNINWSSPGVFFSSPLGPVNILQNEFSYNEGNQGSDEGGGGGLRISKAYDYPVMVDGNRFLHNSEDYGGGFLGQYSYNLKLTNNVFIGNDAIEGGAIRIYLQGSSNVYRPQIINNTFFSNSASNYGGAISYRQTENGSSPVILNCIFWENSASPAGGKDIDNWSSDTVFVYNSDINIDDIFGSWYGKDNFDADPELEEDSIHLQGGSPCINMGLDSLVINGTSYCYPDHDIDGDPRPLNDTVDVGADEYDLLNGIVSLDNTLDDPSIQIFPNPFPITTNIKFNLQSAGQVELSLFDYSGRKVRALISNNLQAGIHEIKIDLSDLQPGIYFCTLKTNEGIKTKKIIKL